MNDNFDTFEVCVYELASSWLFIQNRGEESKKKKREKKG